MSRESDPAEAPKPFQPDEWVSAKETIRRVRAETLSRSSEIAIATRAHAGLLRTNAALLVYKDQRRKDHDVPHTFWWAEGHEALTQNWELGDFETRIDRVRVQAFGVRFYRADIDDMLGSIAPTAIPAVAPEPGGRPMSTLWPDWVAELAMLIHDEGIPENAKVEELIKRVADRLAERGLDTPGRTTVQETARAVLRRLLGAEN